jgi:hypothetical protein
MNFSKGISQQTQALAGTTHVLVPAATVSNIILNLPPQ